ncbi:MULTISPECIES: hypothetical protein [unclassified Streptomyces]|uniref:hypothetical protein n=1 Tax=unclassified Streptomyces TaxID=2593676 RepID=UPI0023658105|nr:MULTISPECIES: hypothetical protein [unclassified Streptomyces]MDF3144510.1 hypothetical protein [Streptomyces sp. T21Q-yed]WDF38931.1 hypothetical protein PBV52_20060 [Streptomyces sp. T12]
MPSDHSQQAPPAAGALKLLPLPKTSTLSDAQRRGVNCAWCAIVLTAETARSLGARPAPGGGQMFPRGCISCVSCEAERVYNVHSRSCPRCAAGRAECGIGRALQRTTLEGR